jgi:predicted DNA-binding protein with PD1-like motif
MRSHELTIGRTYGVVFDHGEDFYASLEEFCRSNGIRQGYVHGFIAGFSTAELVGTCGKLEDPQAPVWSSVHLTNVEALGAGTIAYDRDDDTFRPHIHVTVGLKEHSATGHTSHLLSAQVQFLTELMITEVAAPTMYRQLDPTQYNVPRLHFGSSV